MFRFSPNPNRANHIRWRHWAPETFQEAAAQNKPLMLFLHAFWCGFCHRMDETSFSNDEIIALLNAYFVPMRVEEAQHPDIDARYNQNGWPTIVFMTPEGRHLASVNYLPPDEFGQILVWVHRLWQEKRAELERTLAADTKQISPQHFSARPARGLEMSLVHEISGLLLGLADAEHGGYGTGPKFLDVEATEFLLRDFEASGDGLSLVHALRTLDGMANGTIWDNQEGGFFRYSSKPDWNAPHREKLLRDQAGLLRNYLHAFLLTERPQYRRIAESIIRYLNTKLADPYSGGFWGCEDYIRADPITARDYPPTWVTAVDHCLYVDANAATASAYLEAAWVLGQPECAGHALRLIRFLWSMCRDADGGMCHYFDSRPQVAGLLGDQVFMGEALLDAYQATSEAHYLAQATELANGILDTYVNPSGGFYDIRFPELAGLQFRLTPLRENATTAAFLTRLAFLSGEERFREGARWALQPFTEDFHQYGTAAAGYGLALRKYLGQPLRVTLVGDTSAPQLRILARAVLTRFGQCHLVITVTSDTVRGKDTEGPALYLEDDRQRWGPLTDPRELEAVQVFGHLLS